MQNRTNLRYTLSASGLLLGIGKVVAPQQLSQSPCPDAPAFCEISGLAPRRLDRSRAKRGGAERPSLDDRRLIVERRSLDYAALRAAPLGTTGDHASSSTQCSGENEIVTAAPSSRRLTGGRRTISRPRALSMTYCT